MAFRPRIVSSLSISFLFALWLNTAACGADSAPPASETKTAQPTEIEQSDVSLDFDTNLVRTGFVEMDNVGGKTALASKVIVTITNLSTKPCSTTALIIGKDAQLASVHDVTQEEKGAPNTLVLGVVGLGASKKDSEIFLKAQASIEGKVVAEKTIPIRVVIPTTVKTGAPLYEGPTYPGLKHRILNMRTMPKAAVQYPEAKMARTCLHDLEMLALDQFGDPLPPCYEGAAIFAALGKGDFETSHRKLTNRATWIDTLGTFAFVGDLEDISTELGKALVGRFESEPCPPLSNDQYKEYDPIIVEYSIGGHKVGIYERQITLIRSGNDSKPNIKVKLQPSEAPKGPPIPVYLKDENGNLIPVDTNGNASGQ